MGKVGSQSVYRSLIIFFEEKHMYVPIYNIHVCMISDTWTRSWSKFDEMSREDNNLVFTLLTIAKRLL